MRARAFLVGWVSTIHQLRWWDSGENVQTPAGRVVVTNTLSSEHRIELRPNLLELFAQHFIPFDSIAANLLIHIRGHPRQIGYVRLESGLAVAHRRRENLFGYRVHTVCHDI